MTNILLPNTFEVGKFYLCFFERSKNIFPFLELLKRKKMCDKFVVKQNEILIACDSCAYLFSCLNFEHLTINVQKL